MITQRSAPPSPMSGESAMADAPQTGEPNPERPIVPFLALGERPHLVGLRCNVCGATYLKSGRVGCAKCGQTRDFDTIALSDRGTLWVYSIVHQSAPGIPVPYVAAIVDLPDKVSVRCTLIDVEPDPAKLRFGMPVKMITKKVRTDKEGRDVIAFFFRPDDGK
jgi:uncharacterized OB-fold protein